METMKLKVKEYVYEKVLKGDVNIEIPTESYFYQEDAYRAIYCLSPEKIKNGCYWMRIIKLDTINSILYTANFYTNVESLNELISMFGIKGKSSSEYIVEDVLRYLMNFYGQGEISKDTFVVYYDDFVKKLDKLLEIK